MHASEVNREREPEAGALPEIEGDTRNREPGHHRWGPLIVGSGLAAATIAVFKMGFPALIVAPLLFAWIRIRYGTVGSLSALGLSVVVAAGLGSLEGGVAALTWGATGTLLAWGHVKRWRPSGVMGLSAVPLVLLSALQATVLIRPDARAVFLSELGAAIDETARLPNFLGSRPEDLEAAKHLVLGVGEVLWLVTPAMGFISAAILSFTLYRVAQWLFPKFGIDVRPVAPFGRWAVGERFIWLVAVGLVLEVSRVPSAMAAGHNLLLIAGFAYMVQGASVLRHLLETRRVSKTGQVLVWVVGFLFLQPMSSVLAVAAGILDTWFDFRARLGTHRV